MQKEDESGPLKNSLSQELTICFDISFSSNSGWYHLEERDIILQEPSSRKQRCRWIRSSASFGRFPSISLRLDRLRYIDEGRGKKWAQVFLFVLIRSIECVSWSVVIRWMFFQLLVATPFQVTICSLVLCGPTTQQHNSITIQQHHYTTTQHSNKIASQFHITKYQQSNKMQHHFFSKWHFVAWLDSAPQQQNTTW